MRRAVWIAGIVGLGSGMLACGGGGESGGLGPPPSTLDGVWNFTVTNLHATVQGSLFTCSVAGATINLTQSGTDFSGTYSGGNLNCTWKGQSQIIPVAGEVIGGSLIGNAVSFDLDTPDFHFTGSVTRNSMSGTCVMTVVFPSPIGVAVFNGSWRATR